MSANTSKCIDPLGDEDNFDLETYEKKGDRIG